MSIKEKIKQSLRDQITKELDAAMKIYDSSKQLTQSDDFKSESKWDTRAIEAGYLASAQKQRVEELKLERKLIEEIDLSPIPEGADISVGALVELEHNNITKHYFLSSTAGGTALMIDQTPILVISVFSPLGRELVGLSVGDEVDVEIGKTNKQYTVITIC